MTRVLHFHHQWLPESEPFVWDLIRYLPGRSLVVSDEPSENRDRFPVDRVVDIEPKVRWIPSSLRQQVVTAGLTVYGMRHRIELVHAHHGYELVRVAGAARRLDIPIVVSLHGHDAFGWVDRNPRAYDGLLDHADAVIVPSRFLEPRAVELGAVPDRVHVIGSGVDTAFFVPTPLPDAPEVLFVGRFVEKKGLDVLAAAWPRVRAAVPDAVLRVLGYGPLEHLADRCGASVELRPDRYRVRDAMQAARVVVSPSRTAVDDVAETLLMVNLEAQASGRPVVTTDHGGISEYVDPDQTALVVPENDPDALADALVTALTDRELAERLGGNGPARAAPQDVRAVAQRVATLYRAVER